MIALLIFFVTLSVLVLVHEFGHFFVARLFGVKADEFGYGFPPRLIGFVRSRGKWKRVGMHDGAAYPQTIWSLNWLPLGGFVRLKGEEGGHANDPDSFLAKSPVKRFAILIAGVGMNWLLAALIFIAGLSVGVPMQTAGLPSSAIVRDQKVQIVDVIASSAAETAGIAPGDVVSMVNGKSVRTADDLQASLVRLAQNKQAAKLDLVRHNASVTVTAHPVYSEAMHRIGFGVALADTGVVRFVWYEAIGRGFVIAAQYTKMIVLGLYQLVHDLVTTHRVSMEVSGPVGIAVMTGKVAAQGFWPVMELMAMLSLNLAIVNLLPIPALDGGRALFVIIESFRRHRFNQKFEAQIHRIGFIVLIVLVFLVTFYDLRQYGGMIVQGLKHVAGI